MEDRLVEAARGAIYVLRWQLDMMHSGSLKVNLEGHEATNESFSQLLGVVTDLEAALADPNKSAS